MLFQRYYFYCVTIPSDFDIMFENVKRKYIKKRAKYSDFFKTDRTNIITSGFIGSLIFLSLSIILFFPAIFLPSHYASTKWCVFLIVLFLLVGLTLFFTALNKVLYRGYDVFNRAFFVISFIFYELILVELGFICGYVFFFFFIPFYFPLYFGFVFIPILQLMMIMGFFIIFYLFSHLTYKAVVFTEVYVEHEYEMQENRRLIAVFVKNPLLVIVLMLIPFVNLLLFAILLYNRSKNEVTVINKVG